MSEIEQLLTEIQATLLEGKTILYPTDTIWGLGCDATNSQAIDHIYNIKKRPENKSFILLFSDIEMIKKYSEECTDDISYIEEARVPTTFIVDFKLNLPSILSSETGTFAIRIPKNELCIQIIKKLGRPIVSTSANISGDVSPKKFHEISNTILNAVDFVIPEKYDNGTGKASKIVKKINDQFIVIR